MDAALSLISRCQPVRTHYRVFDALGRLRWVTLASCPKTDAIGAVIGSSGLVMDVTEVVQSGVTMALAETAQSRARIEQAKGVLMVVYGLTADQAFEALILRSQHTNIKLRTIAGAFLDMVSGRLPSAIRPQIERALMAAATRPEVNSAV